MTHQISHTTRFAILVWHDAWLGDVTKEITTDLLRLSNKGTNREKLLSGLWDITLNITFFTCFCCGIEAKIDLDLVYKTWKQQQNEVKHLLGHTACLVWQIGEKQPRVVPLGQIDLEHCGTWSPGGFLSVGWHDLGHCDVVSGEVDDVDKPKQISSAAMPSYEGGRCVQKGQQKGITTNRLEHIRPSQ